MDQRHEQLLRQLAVLDHNAVESILPDHARHVGAVSLDERTAALVRLTGIIALQSAPQAYGWGVAAALGAGCREEDVVDVLAVLVPVIGLTRVCKAAADIADTIGCDIDRPGNG